MIIRLYDADMLAFETFSVCMCDERRPVLVIRCKGISPTITIPACISAVACSGLLLVHTFRIAEYFYKINCFLNGERVCTQNTPKTPIIVRMETVQLTTNLTYRNKHPYVI